MDPHLTFDSRLLKSSDGTQVYAEAVGDQRNPSIVFLHGFTISAGVFNRIFHDPKYSKDFYLVRYDMRGHGRSGKPDSESGYKSHLYADDYAAVASAFKLKNSVFVGWSLGGTIIADITAHLPKDTISGGVYLGSGFFSTSYIPIYATDFAKKCVEGLVNPHADASVLQSAMTNFSKGIFAMKSDTPRAELDRYDTQCTWMGYGAHQSAFHKRMNVFREQDATNLFALGKEGFPILIIHGTDDALVDGNKVVNDAKKYFKNLDIKMISKGGSHAIFYEIPEDVMKLISEFARRVQTGPRSRL